MSTSANESDIRAATERMLRVRPAVERDLMRIGGVRGVGVGIRQRRGALTGEIVFRVYVDEKKPRNRLRSVDVLPRHIDGFLTDVHTIARARPQCCSKGNGGARPLVAGAPIGILQDAKGSSGTLGCFLKMPDNSIAVLSNEHVLESNRLSGDFRLFQPFHDTCCGSDTNDVGMIAQNNGLIGEVNFDDGSGAGTQPFFIDCAIARIKGQQFRNVFVTVNNTASGAVDVMLPPGVTGTVRKNPAGQVVEIRDSAGTHVDTTKILGSTKAELNTLVWKIGATTGLTVGVIEDLAAAVQFPILNDPNGTRHHLIKVRPLAGFVDPTDGNVFSRQGDSGSTYVNLANRVVGIHHHTVATRDPDTGVLTDVHSYGSHIAPVLAHFPGAVVIDHDTGDTKATAARSNILASELWTEAPAGAHDFESIGRQAGARLETLPRGRVILSLIEEHGHDVIELVRGRRAVTVVWHRHHGPAFVALFARALLESRDQWPTVVEGISRRTLLSAMADVLSRQGNVALAAAIIEHRAWLVELLAECRDLDGLLGALAEAAA